MNKLASFVVYLQHSHGAMDIFALSCRHWQENGSSIALTLTENTLAGLMALLVNWRGKEEYKIVQIFISILQNPHMPADTGKFKIELSKMIAEFFKCIVIVIH